LRLVTYRPRLTITTRNTFPLAEAKELRFDEAIRGLRWQDGGLTADV